MNQQNKFENPEFLKTNQYKDAQNLKARIALHSRYTVAKQDWSPWVFDHLKLKSGEQILECGGGSGLLWRKNIGRIPAGCQITFTDLSAGMIAEAQSALAESGFEFSFQTADVMDLPFPDHSFDAVVANHMLYHVPNRAQALAEITRVLRPTGRFFTATNGKNHLKELLELGVNLFPPAPTPQTVSRLRFSLENGRGQLEPFFKQIQLHLYNSHLAVSEIDPILNYLGSTIDGQEALTSERQSQIIEQISKEIRQTGSFYISKSSGMFEASQPITHL